MAQAPASNANADHVRARIGPSPAAPLPEDVTSIQPGGGVCYSLELAWGRARRWLLKTLRPGYVQRMRALRLGDPAGCPHEVLDPRDLKFHRNQCSAHWPPAADRFRWRGKIPFARWGLAELQIFSYPLLALAVGLGIYRWYLAILPAVPLALVLYFFRDPPRRVPLAPGLVVSPADGRVVEIARLEHDPFLDGPAVRIGIFLSIFNVHINRAPCDCRVVELRYNPGRFMNAIAAESARVNENMWIGLEEPQPPYRRAAVRQIAGAIARRIVCDLKPDEALSRGQQFGMIKLGSRTELVLPDEPALEVTTSIGARVKAGASVLARFNDSVQQHNGQASV